MRFVFPTPLRSAFPAAVSGWIRGQGSGARVALRFDSFGFTEYIRLHGVCSSFHCCLVRAAHYRWLGNPHSRSQPTFTPGSRHLTRFHRKRCCLDRCRNAVVTRCIFRPIIHEATCYVFLDCSDGARYGGITSVGYSRVDRQAIISGSSTECSVRFALVSLGSAGTSSRHLRSHTPYHVCARSEWR